MPLGECLRNLEDLRWIPGSLDALRALSENHGIRPIVVTTNQAGISRGELSWDDAMAVNRKFMKDVRVDGYYLCPHAPADNCDCRKPKAGLVLRAALTHDFAPNKSLVIGDYWDDMHLAERIGAEFVLVRTGRGQGVFEVLTGQASLLDVHQLAIGGAYSGGIASDFQSAVPAVLHWWNRQGALTDSSD